MVNEDMKKAKYHDMLKDEIREIVSMSSYRNLEDIIMTTRERKIDLKIVRKRKLV